MTTRDAGSGRRGKQFQGLARALLGGMVEGVVATDAEQRVLFANDRAVALLELASPVPVGRKFWEVVRQRGLQEVLSRALAAARPVCLTPLTIRRREVFVPMDNKLYHLARTLGVLKRDAFVWSGDIYAARPAADKADGNKRLCIRTEVAWLRLGELDVACIPGEIYPELVLDRVQNPADPGADYPEAPVEAAIYRQLKGPYRMILGLANDEIGYILPKRQWDEQPPFCYGRKKPQYGEGNSVGPETAPLLCGAFRELVRSRR